ncbi:MAG: hypothetical protein ACKO38_17865 [Planctomycetota bacterium]
METEAAADGGDGDMVVGSDAEAAIAGDTAGMAAETTGAEWGDGDALGIGGRDGDGDGNGGGVAGRDVDADGGGTMGVAADVSTSRPGPIATVPGGRETARERRGSC